MSERERWIVYPLLFLALGAALRDKIIKTTESQRIKCQGLCVFDSQDQPLLILGPEQFPELRPNVPNLIRVDDVITSRVDADLVSGKKIVGARFAAPQDSVGVLDAEMVIAKNYVLSDGTNHFKIDGRWTVPLIRFVTALRQQVAARMQARTQPEATADTATPSSESGPTDTAAPPVEQPDSPTPPTDPQPTGEQTPAGELKSE